MSLQEFAGIFKYLYIEAIVIILSMINSTVVK